jgi:hypothetical protein
MFEEVLSFIIHVLPDPEVWRQYDESVAQERSEYERKQAEYQAFVKSKEAPPPVIQPPRAVIEQTGSAGPAVGGVSENGQVRIRYQGGSVGFKVPTADGKKIEVARGATYTVTNETWQNLQEFNIGKWEKLR